MPYQPGNRSQPSSGKPKGSNPQGRQNLNNLLDQLSQKLGPSPEQLKSAAKSGDTSKLLDQLKPDDAQRLEKILSDKKATEKLLSSPQAQALMKLLQEGK